MSIPHPKGSNIIPTLPVVDVSFDTSAFDRLLKSQSIVLRHMRAMRCPIGLTDKDGYRAPGHEDLAHGNLKCSNGFIYKEAGLVSASFLGNSTQSNMTDIGILDGSTVQATLPRVYDGTDTPVAVSVFDRMHIADEVDITVINWQTIESSNTGTNRLQFPAVAVEHAIDAFGKEYTQDVDFTLVDGAIRWINQPPFNPTLGKGTVLSVRYSYIPFWYVAQIPHEVRVTKVENRYTGERAVQRMQYAVVLKRENVFEDEQKTKVEGTEGQLLDAPSTFGAR